MDDYKKVIDYYVITRTPGFMGRYVISRNVIPAGTTARIVRIERCTNWWCRESRIIIKLPSEQYGDHPVTVRWSREQLEHVSAWERVNAT
jgi:hypothetical protein